MCSCRKGGSIPVQNGIEISRDIGRNNRLLFALLSNISEQRRLGKESE